MTGEREGRLTPNTPSRDDHRGVLDALGWFAPRKRVLWATCAVGTIDQALMVALAVEHGFVRLPGLASKVVIVDEVHAYDVYMSTILERLLRGLAVLGGLSSFCRRPCRRRVGPDGSPRAPGGGRFYRPRGRAARRARPRPAGAAEAERREHAVRFAGRAPPLYGLLPRVVVRLHDVEADFLVATLYRLNPRPGGHGDLGVTLRTVAHASGVNPEGVDRPVAVLLDAHRGDLPFRLRQAVRFVAGQERPVDWPLLLSDVTRWDHPGRVVQKSWVRSLFGASD